MSANVRIVAGDSDRKHLGILRCIFDDEGYVTKTFTEPDEVLKQVNQFGADLVILGDFHQGSCFSLIEQLRDHRFENLILVLNRLSRTEDVLKGFRIGADDYMLKPFEPVILLTKVIRMIERQNASFHVPSKVRVGDAELSLSELTFCSSTMSCPITLSPTEARLLSTLMLRHGEAVSRETINDRVWGYQPTSDSTYNRIDVNIRRIRVKLKKNGGSPDHVKTVRNFGYSYSHNGAFVNSDD